MIFIDFSTIALFLIPLTSYLHRPGLFYAWSEGDAHEFTAILEYILQIDIIKCPRVTNNFPI